MGAEGALEILEFRYIETYWLFYLTVSWLLAFGVVEVLRHRRSSMAWPWHRTLGLALVLWPFVQLTHEIIESIPAVFDPQSVAPTVPEHLWWTAIRRRSVQYIGLPLVGSFLMFGQHLHGDAWRRLGPRLRETLQRIDMWPRGTWNRDVANGFGLFVLFFFGYVALGILVSLLEILETGNEGSVFNELTPVLAVALALLAGITEEILFRGILQTQLSRVMPVWSAIGIQAVFFGLIHSGYGNLGHIVLPLLFGIAAGAIAYRFGVIPVVMIHVLVDLVIFFAITSTVGYPWTALLLPLIFVVSIVYALVYHVPRWLRRFQGGRNGSDANDGNGRDRGLDRGSHGLGSDDEWVPVER